MKTENEILESAVCCKCGHTILQSGFHYSAWYDRYGHFWHIYCWIRNSYNATGNPNAEIHTTNAIVRLYK